MHRIQCNCGTIRAQLDSVGTSNRVICYCTDCRAFALFLQRPDVLDAKGGTEILQVAQSRLVFTHGAEHLAAVRLTETGMIRWYAACCKTPLGNTMPNRKMIVAGLIHSCLDRSQLDSDFGREIALVNTDTAIGEPKPKQSGLFRTVLRFLRILTTGVLSGGYRTSPFFNQAGAPVAMPQVLDSEQLAKLKGAA